MARTSRAKTRRASAGWIMSLLGMFLLISTGFASGLVIGLIAEEPELLLGHLTGRSEEVAWSPDAEPSFSKAVRPISRPESPVVAEREPRPAPPPPVSAARPPARSEKSTRSVSSQPPGAGWAVQVGAFGKSKTAETMVRELDGSGFAAYLTPSARQGEGRWRVRVGPVNTRAEAEELSRRLELEEELPTWILTEGG